VLPSLAVGHSLEHTAFPGTLSVTAETLLALWTDLGQSVARAGVRKLVVFNTHGGQTGLVDLLAVRLRVELGMLVARANYFAFGLPPGLFEPAEVQHGIHGGELETALLLHLRPDLVRREALACFEAATFRMAGSHRWLGPEKPVGFGWMGQDLHPEGVSGHAARADPERGRVLLEHLAQALADLVGEVAATPLGTLAD
jgi:creatinine amidohydrolase